MAEITRVPLKPISRGSLAMLFIGILIGLLIAAVFAWATAPKGVSVDEITAGSGENPSETDIVFVRYTGKLEDGTVFDQSQDEQWPVPGIFPDGFPMQLSQVVPGFREGILRMQRGGKYEILIPAEKAYGESPPPGSPIPPNADLTFEVELIDFMPLEEANQLAQRMQQQMMQQMMGAQGEGGPAGPMPAPGAPPVPTPAPPPAQ